MSKKLYIKREKPPFKISLCGSKISFHAGDINQDLEKLSAALDQYSEVEYVTCIMNDIGANEAQIFSSIFNKCENVRTLKLTRCKIDNEAVNILAKELFSKLYLIDLDLSCNEIGGDGAECLADMLVNNTTMQELNLSSNKIRDNGLEHLASSLCRNKPLKKLNISSNEIGAEGTGALFKNICNSKIVILKMGSNRIGDKGLEVIARVLNDTNIEELHVGNNNIGDCGVERLACALKNNQTLKVLMLTTNKISDVGAIHLAESLKDNNSMTKLFLALNLMIRDEGVKLLLDVLPSTSIVDLCMSMHKVSPEMTAEFVEKTKKPIGCNIKKAASKTSSLGSLEGKSDNSVVSDALDIRKTFSEGVQPMLPLIGSDNNDDIDYDEILASSL